MTQRWPHGVHVCAGLGAGAGHARRVGDCAAAAAGEDHLPCAGRAAGRQQLHAGALREGPCSRLRLCPVMAAPSRMPSVFLRIRGLAAPTESFALQGELCHCKVQYYCRLTGRRGMLWWRRSSRERHQGACQAGLAVQVVIAEILEAWGDEGFEAHVTDMQQEYSRRASIIQVL